MDKDIVREFYEIKVEINKLQKRQQELRKKIVDIFSVQNTDEIYTEDILIYRVNRPKVEWEETELKTILSIKGFWDDVITVDNLKLKNLIDEGKISEAEIENYKRKTDMWYIYAKKKVGRIRIKDLQKGVGFTELDTIVISKGKLRQGVSISGKKWKRNHLSIKDETASIKLILWDEKTKIIDDINIGDRILIKNGYVNEYTKKDDRELQISLRKDSVIEVINSKEKIEDFEEEEEEEEEGYDVYEEYKEDSWRGKG